MTNVPWGLQTAKGGGELLQKIYRGIVLSAHPVTARGSHMVILVLKWAMVVDLARRSGLWSVVDVVPMYAHPAYGSSLCLFLGLVREG